MEATPHAGERVSEQIHNMSGVESTVKKRKQAKEDRGMVVVLSLTGLQGGGGGQGWINI